LLEDFSCERFDAALALKTNLERLPQVIVELGSCKWRDHQDRCEQFDPELGLKKNPGRLPQMIVALKTKRGRLPQMIVALRTNPGRLPQMIVELGGCYWGDHQDLWDRCCASLLEDFACEQFDPALALKMNPGKLP